MTRSFYLGDIPKEDIKAKYEGGVPVSYTHLSKLLNTQGYETVLLTDFGNLTEELKQYSIELVLLDINLPYENGYEVCRKIKQVMPGSCGEQTGSAAEQRSPARPWSHRRCRTGR